MTMSTDIAFKNNLPAAARSTVDNMTDSGGNNFPTMSIRGSKFRVKKDGVEEVIKDNSTGAPVGMIEVVLIDIQAGESRNYFSGKYSPENSSGPKCWSDNGITPSGGEEQQSTKCATCPQSQWGSEITDSGKKIQACKTFKRVALTPAGDLHNSTWGGPMMLRVPRNSLGNMKKYGMGMKQKGFEPFQIVTRLSFDDDAAYPLLTFKAVRPLTANECEIVEELNSGTQVRSIMDGSTSAPEAPQASAPKQVKKQVDCDFEQPAPPTDAVVQQELADLAGDLEI